MKTVIEMALNSGDDEWKILVRQVMKHFPDEFERFVELVRADERVKLAERPSKPDYAWPTVADYERDVGFQTNEAFRMAWNMARTTNTILGIKEKT